MYNKFAHACRNAMIRISPGTSAVNTIVYTAQNSRFMADVRDYFAITATRRGSSPESQDGGPGHGTTREITNSPP